MTPPPTVEQIQRGLDTLVLYHERRFRNLEAEFRRALDDNSLDPLRNVEVALTQQRELLKRMPTSVSRTFVATENSTSNLKCYALTPGNDGFSVQIDDWHVAIIPVPDLLELAKITAGSFCTFGLVVSVNGGVALSEAHIESLLSHRDDDMANKSYRSSLQQNKWHEQEMAARSQWQNQLAADKETRIREQAERDREIIEQRNQNRMQEAPAKPNVGTVSQNKNQMGKRFGCIGMSIFAIALLSLAGIVLHTW